MRITTDQETIKSLREKGNDIRDDGKGVHGGISFRCFIDRSTARRYRVYEGEKEVPVHRSLVPVVS